MPEEIAKKIKDDSIKMFPFVGMARTTYERKAYVAGATEWAELNIAWSKKSQALEKEHQQLKERCDKMEAALEWIKTYGPDQSIEGQAFIDKALKGKEVELSCVVCGTKFMGPEPKMCCSGRDCGCMGLPIDPIVCSKECYENLPSRRKDTECSVVGMCTKCGRHYPHKNQSGICKMCEGKEVENGN